MKNTFLNSSVPEQSKSRSVGTRTTWGGLNFNASADSGYITDGENFIITPDNTVRAADKPKYVSTPIDGEPLFFKGLDGKLVIVANKSGTNVDIACMDENGNVEVANLSNTSLGADTLRSVAIYNVWKGGSDIVSGEYEPRLIIFPDKETLPVEGEWNTTSDITRFNVICVQTTYTKTTMTSYDKYTVADDGTITADSDSNKSVVRHTDTSSAEYVYDVLDYEPDDMSVSYPVTESDKVTTETSEIQTFYDMDGAKECFAITKVETWTEETFRCEACDAAIPDADHVVVQGTRLFGVKGSKIFASAAGSYANFELDTATDSDENNAWYSATQSGGDFTALCVYGGRVTAFKKDALYELYNTKNPYRVKEICSIGTFESRSVCETQNTLFFVSSDGVYAYGGSYPRNISKAVLGVEKLLNHAFKNGIAGAESGKYYLREPITGETGSPVLVYDTVTGFWGKINFSEDEIYGFASCGGHIYAILDSGSIYQLDSGNKASTEWYFETPAETGGTADIKVLEKIQLTANFHTSGSIKISVKYDNGVYEEVASFSKENSGIYPIYAKLRKSDHVARFIRFDMAGDVEIMNFEQYLTGGGEMYGP